MDKKITPPQTTMNDNNFSNVGDTPSFNLWTEAWLPLEMLDGSVKPHSIRDALLHAHEFRAIADPSPLVVVGVHRLLTAILQDALRPQANADLDDLWRAGHFPDDKIADFGEAYADRFDLFSPDKPFLQSADLPMVPRTKEEKKERTTVAKLFIEIPTGTGIAHYRHSLEDEIVLTPASAALGLVAMPPFVSSGGPGLMPSINGVPPIYVLPGGTSLFEQLVSSLLASSGNYAPLAPDSGDLVWWRRTVPTVVVGSKKKSTKVSLAESKQLSAVGYLHGLTFPARKVRLHPERDNTVCSRSGKATTWAVKTMAFCMGESMLEEANVWRDPFAAYKLPEPPKTNKHAKARTKKKIEKPKPIRPAVNKGRAAWREFSGLFLRRTDTSRAVERPRFLDQLSRLQISEQRSIHTFQCIGLQTDGKMKFFEWFDFGFDVPPALLSDPDGARWTDDALTFATNCATSITQLFAEVFGGTSKKALRFARLKSRMEVDFWQVMGERFRSYVSELGDEAARSVRLDRWLDEAKREAQASFDCAADATGDNGSTLRLIEQGKARCRIKLAALRNKTNQLEVSEGAMNDTIKPRTRKAKSAKRTRR
jgi:CRISPR system Cascade subunit CasA